MTSALSPGANFSGLTALMIRLIQLGPLLPASPAAFATAAAVLAPSAARAPITRPSDSAVCPYGIGLKPPPGPGGEPPGGTAVGGSLPGGWPPSLGPVPVRPDIRRLVAFIEPRAASSI